MPIPDRLPTKLDELVQRYVGILADRAKLFSQIDQRANEALCEIDAAILEAYDLSPRLERRVLEYFRGKDRPTLHEWQHWFPESFKPYIPLREFISPKYRKMTRPWIREVFEHLPVEEADGLSDYMD